VSAVSTGDPAANEPSSGSQRTLRGARLKAQRGAPTELLARLARNLGSVAISIVVTLVLWIGFIKLFHVDHAVARNPADVWRYMFSAPSALHHRNVLFHNLLTTLRDAALGYVTGMVSAVVVASVFILARTLEQAFMPVALVLRSVPLIAMAPLITLIFGRDIAAISVIGGIVCFFPALINIMYGLRSTPRSAIDLMRSYGASRTTILRKVMFPSAMPAIFASLRILVPAALIGGLLSEWLATGRGSGNEMITVLRTFDYDELWSAVVLVTLTSIVLYSVVRAIEGAALARYAPDSVGRTS